MCYHFSLCSFSFLVVLPATANFRKLHTGKFLKGALTQTQKFGCCKQTKWIWSTTFFSFCKQSHMSPCDHFLSAIDTKNLSVADNFFVFPQSHQTKFTKNWKRRRIKIRKRKIHRQKKLSDT